MNLLLQHLVETQPISDSRAVGLPEWKIYTVTALLENTHNWFNVLEKSKEVGAVFFDFRKAFDSVPHRTLLAKLDDLQVNHLLIQWIHSYLSKRKQQVVVNGSSSDALPVWTGVPEGSVIGP